MEVFSSSSGSEGDDNAGKDYLSCSSHSSKEDSESSNESWDDKSASCENNRLPSEISKIDGSEVQILSVRRRSLRLMNASLAKKRQESLREENERGKQNRVKDMDEELDDTLSMESSESCNGADESGNVGNVNIAMFSCYDSDGIEYIVLEEEGSEEIKRPAKCGECSKHAASTSHFSSRIFSNGSNKNSESGAKHDSGMQYAPKMSDDGEDPDDNAASKDCEVMALFEASRKNNIKQSKTSREIQLRQRKNKLQKASIEECVNVAYTEEHSVELRDTKKASLPEKDHVEAEQPAELGDTEKHLEVHNKREKARGEASTCMRENISGDKVDEEVFSNVLASNCPEDGMASPYNAYEDEASTPKPCLEYAKLAPDLMIPTGTEDGDGVQDPFEPMINEIDAKIKGIKRAVSVMKEARINSEPQR